MEKIELTKSECDNIIFRQNLIQKKIQEMTLINNEISIIKRDSSYYVKELIAKHGVEYGKDGDWSFDGASLIKEDKNGIAATNSAVL